MTVVLSGIDGTNPLGFLVALGALALAADGHDDTVRLAWERVGAAWRPRLNSTLVAQDAVVGAVCRGHALRDLALELGWERDLAKLTREEVRGRLSARLEADAELAARMVAACVSELPQRHPTDPHVAYTPFRLIPHVGKARFLTTARELSALPRPEAAVETALFGPWQYVKANSLRLDPAAPAPVRAYLAEAPTHLGPRAVPGAMLLAVAGLRFFPLVLDGRRAACHGFGHRPDELRWPMWTQPLVPETVDMLLGLPDLYADEPDAGRLRRHGVAARLLAQRTPLGDGYALSWGEQR